MKHTVTLFALAFGACCYCMDGVQGEQFEQDSKTDGGALRPELCLPKNSAGRPAAGKRVPVTAPEYEGTDVHHMVYLPNDWTPAADHKYPVIVEFTGNYFPTSGSTGKVEDAALGYGISGGRFIWVTLPFVSQDRKENAVRWWGDESATVEYAKTNVPRICEQFGGDPKAAFICGFSRGAIATNYIGLYDDEIAKLWCGFITHDHYDGVKEWKGTSWGTPLAAYRKTAAERLGRLNGRPSLICQSGGTKQIADYLRPIVPLESLTFVNVNTRKILGDFPNNIAVHPHTDRWLVKNSDERRKVWAWVQQVVKQTRDVNKPTQNEKKDD